MSCGAVGYRFLLGRAYRYLQRARDTRDILFQQLRALTEGMKELKLHADRREAFMSERIVPTTEALRRDTLSGIRHDTVADSFSQFVFYGLIAGLLLLPSVIPSFSVEARTGFVLAMLYLMTPLWSLMDTWSTFARARIAVEKVRALGLTLAGADTEHARADSKPPAPWQRLELEQVTFAYPSNQKEQGFALGLLDFSLGAGELVLLVGGNGSGKSTLIKVLTGLYSPQSGSIRVDGQLITEANREGYVRRFSAVFSDFYLFDSLLGVSTADLDTRAGSYLLELELAEKVQIADGVFSTTALSQGQRRRLALLTV